MKLRGRRASTDDAVVELTRVAFIGEAIAIKQDLERVGIHAAVFQSDAGGWAPHYGIEQGNRVMVLAKDLAHAQQLLSDDGGQLPVEEPPSSDPVRKHLRTHGDA
ncbi:MAG: hypothetical protein QOF20_1980 [Acidimicrobiaceae bacterium]|jgi:hypothetical protein|nr:hypothetical protein [Acidimicrobiaceae bacterium]MDQ1369627.1 hypothetical protein [Acidimicrobiaceae bacterium]MDQ1378534.1 hypothetical protein [Acidimicrobiaceae bacterium]MDQ1412554.1 hypothetical protein [Acidimicrobiaceae bacterium]MDQ1417339.1 hypothetical protein [Acidimicrobiaceae bacterium]